MLPNDGTARCVIHGDDIASYCILLPKLSKQGLQKADRTNNDDGEAIYMLIDSEWSDIQSDGTIGLPKEEGATYNY